MDDIVNRRYKYSIHMSHTYVDLTIQIVSWFICMQINVENLLWINWFNLKGDTTHKNLKRTQHLMV